MTAELMVTLQEIKIYALKQKGDLLKGGRAIPEQMLEDRL